MCKHKIYPNPSKSKIMTHHTPCKNSMPVGIASHSIVHWLPHRMARIACPITCAESCSWLGCSSGTVEHGPALAACLGLVFAQLWPWKVTLVQTKLRPCVKIWSMQLGHNLASRPVGSMMPTLILCSLRSKCSAMQIPIREHWDDCKPRSRDSAGKKRNWILKGGA